jgi:threonine synthase
VGLISTRGWGGGISVSEALRMGLAPDGGLLVPDAMPRLDPGVVDTLREDAASIPRSAWGNPEALAKTARAVLGAFLDHPDDAALLEALPTLCREAFWAAIPLRELGSGDAKRGGQACLELFHGPTAAFKDFAARFLAGALALDPGAPTVHVLVATSGDTGSAVASAFAGRPGFRVTVLFPERGVSERQAHLLSCFGDRGNVQSFRVQGSFDDAQRVVKAALGDPDLRRTHHLTSANSISIGRLLPQMTWFAHHALCWEGRTGRAPGFIVPSGNFGHGLAAVWASELGFPVGRVQLATNRNRALVDWMRTGRAEPRKSVRTPANAMDVGVPSNLERLAHTHPDPAALRGILSASAIDDDEILATVADAPGRWGVTVCPHTACALHALGELRSQGDTGDWIVTATAHPAKFPEIVEPAIGRPVPVPPALADLLAKPADAEPLEASLGALLDVL